ncbi:hypothetical protein BVRB_5g103790 [Beta vulgaris subsp. vulgaris]|nr:hypothetical protein BVRB_5g103790 [Beta vulgaris subsp. vulgaris]
MIVVAAGFKIYERSMMTLGRFDAAVTPSFMDGIYFARMLKTAVALAYSIQIMEDSLSYWC